MKNNTSIPKFSEDIPSAMYLAAMQDCIAADFLLKLIIH